MEWLNTLLFLACPLMMIFMMLGGHGHGGGHGKKAHLEHSHGMHKRIQKLEEENQRLKKGWMHLINMIRRKHHEDKVAGEK
ncbi:hypothetical protein P9759_04645 [Heyndrickxia coagulans]|uniref:hypothetical protein n=1 Tax=Heyndrickxia coagulans TaxID=1398 RepID=UPI002E1B4B22|nr:hypothetical protein [Heyndrickxia coagulans]